METERPVLAPRRVERAELQECLATALLLPDERELALLRLHARESPSTPLWEACGLDATRSIRLRELACGGAAEAECRRAGDLGLSLVAWRDSRFPPALFDLAGPPTLLYVHGVLPTPPPEGKTPLTIVGARTSTARGRAFAAELARAVARRGGLAVSGLAIGIDQAAHEGALEGGGPSVAVVACGLDRIYPPGAEPLARRLASNGAVVSEMPIGTAPWKSHFPRRNRLLAAWSRATLVIEADLASGSLITARRALELGRDVLAMPGPIDAPTSRGTNRLIRDGAHPLLEVADVDLLLPAAKSRGEAATVNSHAAGAPVADDELLAALATPMALDALSTAFGLSTGDLAVRLVDLEAARAVRRLAGGLWGRT